MTTGPDSFPNDGALTPEERALAARLARSAPQRGPSAALDARILDAARAAAQPQAVDRPAIRHRRRPRWPMITGVAASLMLAFGVVWQLRPTVQLETASAPAARVPPSAPGAGGPSAADDYSPMPAEDAAADAAASEVPKPQAVVAEAKQAAPVREQAADAAREEAAVPAMAPPQEPGYDAYSAAPAAVAPAPPPAPPAPMAAPEARRAPTAFGTQSAPAAEAPGIVGGNAANDASRARKDESTTAKRAASDSAELDSVIVTGSNVRQEKSRDAASAAAADKAADGDDAGAPDASSYDAEHHDQPLDDEPPASAEAPEVRDAWLKRVRDLLGRGDRAAARDSLREYQRRNPDARIPDDLKPLLSE
jgi:hypothetical protein